MHFSVSDFCYFFEKKKDSKINIYIDKKYSSFMQRVSVEVEHGCERDLKNK